MIIIRYDGSAFVSTEESKQSITDRIVHCLNNCKTMVVLSTNGANVIIPVEVLRRNFITVDWKEDE